MSISAETRTAVRQILRSIVVREIPIRWRSGERMPGGGERRSFFKGVGHEFEGTREYSPGDDTRHIDWNSFAASGGSDLQINEFQEPRDIKAYVLCDIGPSMNFGTHRVTKRHLAAELAASCLHSVEETKDRMGMVLFSANKVEKVFKATAPSRIKFQTIAAILEQEQSSEGPGDGLSRALKALPAGRSLVFIISDFMNMTNTDWATLKSASRRHDVRCLFVQDLRERELPEVSWGWGPLGWMMGKLGCFYTLQDWNGMRRTIWVNKKTRLQYAANWRQHEERVIARFTDARCLYQAISTEEGDSAFPKIIKALNGRR